MSLPITHGDDEDIELARLEQPRLEGIKPHENRDEDEDSDHDEDDGDRALLGSQDRPKGREGPSSAGRLWPQVKSIVVEVCSVLC